MRHWMWTTVLTGFLAGPALAAAIVIPFDKADDLAGWQSEYETWLVQDGALTQAMAVSAGKRAVLWRTSQRFGDLDLSVEFRIKDGDAGVSSAGVIYRADSPTDYSWARLDPRPGKQAVTLYRAHDAKETNLLLTSKGILLCGIRYRGDPKTGRRRGACVLFSRDLGRTWSEPVLVAPVIGGYTGMVELPDGRIFMAYYTEGEGSDIRGAYLNVDRLGIQVPRDP